MEHIAPADLNNDGLLDVVSALLSCAPGEPGVGAWLARGGAPLVPAAWPLGLGLTGSLWSVLHSDLTGDGVLDLLGLPEGCAPSPGVALFAGQPPGATGTAYALTQLPPVFTAIGLQSGSPMGAAQADVNGDGVLDYLLTEIELRDFVQKGGKVNPLDPTIPFLKNEISNKFLLSQPDGSLARAGLQTKL